MSDVNCTVNAKGRSVKPWADFVFDDDRENSDGAGEDDCNTSVLRFGRRQQQGSQCSSRQAPVHQHHDGCHGGGRRKRHGGGKPARSRRIEKRRAERAAASRAQQNDAQPDPVRPKQVTWWHPQHAPAQQDLQQEQQGPVQEVSYSIRDQRDQRAQRAQRAQRVNGHNKQKFCRFFNDERCGGCTGGAGCPFLHVLRKCMHGSGCRHKNTCKWRHPAPSVQAQQVYAPWMYTWGAPVQQPAQQVYAPWMYTWGAPAQQNDAQQNDAQPPAEIFSGAEYDHILRPSPAQQDDEATAQQDDEATTKHLLGERLFPLIQEREPRLAGKIMGMLLEMDTTEISNLIADPQALGLKIDEVLAILHAYAHVYRGASPTNEYAQHLAQQGVRR